MAIVNVNPLTAAQPQFGFSAQSAQPQGGGTLFGGFGGYGARPAQQTQFGFPPAQATAGAMGQEGVPSYQAMMPAYGSPQSGQMPGMVGPATGESLNTQMAAYATPEDLLRAGTSAQLEGFDPKQPGGGFYPGLLGGGTQPSAATAPSGPQLYYGQGGAAYGTQQAAQQSYSDTLQDQIGQNVGRVLRSGYTQPVGQNPALIAARAGQRVPSFFDRLSGI